MSRLNYTAILMLSIGVLILGCEKDTAKGNAQQKDSDPVDSESEEETEVETETEKPKDTEIVPVTPVPLCVKECTVPSDCVEVGADKLHRDANYLCTEGECVYIGCVNDANCSEVYSFPAHVCSSEGECLYPCETVVDCVVTGLDADDDNWGCEGGGCVYKGCLNSYECVMTYGDDYTCSDVMHEGVRSCQASCNAPADCVETNDTDEAAYDADNYNCISQQGEIRDMCDYKGCADDAECGTGYKCANPGK